MTARTAGGERCTIRLYRPGDEAAVCRLLNEGFGGWPRTELDVSPVEHLRWKIAEPTPLAVVLAEIDGALVGITMRSLRPARVGSGEVVLQQGFDSCVHPDYRSAGVMSAIRASFGDLLATRGDVLVFVSNHPAFQHIRAHEGATPLGNRVQVFSCEEPAPAGRQPEANSWAIADAERFDERVDAFWRDAAAPFGLIIARTQELLNWRYCDTRAGVFTIRTAEEGGRLLGYAVLRVTNGTGHIADLLALPGREDVARSLVVDALDYFDRRRVSPVQCWSAERHPYRQLLATLGFRKKRSIGLHWVAYTSRPDGDALRDDRLVVHYMAGDSDLV